MPGAARWEAQGGTSRRTPAQGVLGSLFFFVFVPGVAAADVGAALGGPSAFMRHRSRGRHHRSAEWLYHAPLCPEAASTAAAGPTTTAAKEPRGRRGEDRGSSSTSSGRPEVPPFALDEPRAHARGLDRQGGPGGRLGPGALPLLCGHQPRDEPLPPRQHRLQGPAGPQAGAAPAGGPRPRGLPVPPAARGQQPPGDDGLVGLERPLGPREARDAEGEPGAGPSAAGAPQPHGGVHPRRPRGAVAAAGGGLQASAAAPPPSAAPSAAAAGGTAAPSSSTTTSSSAAAAPPPSSSSSSTTTSSSTTSSTTTSSSAAAAEGGGGEESSSQGGASGPWGCGSGPGCSDGAGDLQQPLGALVSRVPPGPRNHGSLRGSHHACL